MSKVNGDKHPIKKKSSFTLPVWYAAAGWEQIPHLIHGFSGRIDDQAAALSALSDVQLPLHTLKQVHGNELRVVGQDTRWTDLEERPQADGMLSAEAGQLLGITTADCVPILMVAPQHRIVAALHAGWRGTAKDICGRAIQCLETDWGVPPAALLVALGPSIDGCCYEVGRDIGENLAQKWGTQGRFAWRPGGDTGFLDLRLVNRLRCEQLGVAPQRIQHVGPCTFCSGAPLSSYRREGTHAGRQLSVIGWYETSGRGVKVNDDDHLIRQRSSFTFCARQ